MQTVVLLDMDEVADMIANIMAKRLNAPQDALVVMFRCKQCMSDKLDKVVVAIGYDTGYRMIPEVKKIGTGSG